ncbi:MAG: NifU family protein [Saprospirales bacterium]|nr:MAG: NifU family protein [Saprospirales bacterium]
MTTATKNPVMLYTEQTPNPESLKYVTNRMLFEGTADFQDKEQAEEWSPLAIDLFKNPYIKGVYICNNFVTITKEFNYNWEDIMLQLKNQLKEYLDSGHPIVNEGYTEAKLEWEKEKQEYDGDDVDIVVKIKDMLQTYVKPAVEMDGGNIEFKGFQDGVVTLVMQGACSGCPSSTVTLKAGIEGMLKRMVPEVKEVVAEMG